jgi:ribose transport system ATP-binding protein
VNTVRTASISQDQLIEMMLGRQLGDFYPAPQTAADHDVRLRATGLAGRIANDVSFDARRGEVLGLTGIAGSGYEEVPYLLFGAQRARAGQIVIDKDVFAAPAMRPPAAIKAGLAFLPADRQRASGAPGMTLAENVSLPVIDRFFNGGRLRHGRETEAVRSLLNEFRVKPADPFAALSELSGGNQQKALLGKWLQRDPSVLLLHEPTQGVDVGAKRDVFDRLRKAAVEGAAVVIASAEYEDLAHLCDRVIVFRNGTPVAVMSGGELSAERIVEQSYRNEPREQRDAIGPQGERP